MSFNLYSKYYDMLYLDKDYKSESEYVIELLNNLSNHNIKSMLELGGGSGNHATFFSNSLNKIYGIELSSKMVDLAMKRNIANYHVENGDICVNHYPNQQFDCAVSLFHVISYLVSNKQIIDCFRSVYEQLKTGGLFLFDVWYTPAVYNLKPENRIKKIENSELKVTRVAQSNIDYISSVVNVNYTIFIEDLINNRFEKIEETHKMRHFTSNEIELFAKMSGFEVVKSEEFLTKSSPSINSWGVMFVLKKV